MQSRRRVTHAFTVVVAFALGIHKWCSQVVFTSRGHIHKRSARVKERRWGHAPIAKMPEGKTTPSPQVAGSSLRSSCSKQEAKASPRAWPTGNKPASYLRLLKRTTVVMYS